MLLINERKHFDKNAQKERDRGREMKFLIHYLLNILADDLKLTVRFWKSHALNLVIASFEKTFGTFRLFAPVAEPPPLPVFPSLRTDSLPPSSFSEPHIDNDSSPGNTTWLPPYFFFILEWMENRKTNYVNMIIIFLWRN